MDPHIRMDVDDQPGAPALRLRHDQPAQAIVAATTALLGRKRAVRVLRKAVMYAKCRAEALPQDASEDEDGLLPARYAAAYELLTTALRLVASGTRNSFAAARPAQQVARRESSGKEPDRFGADALASVSAASFKTAAAAVDLSLDSALDCQPSGPQAQTALGGRPAGLRAAQVQQRTGVPHPASQPVLSPHLQSLLNPDLAKAVLPDGVTPDAMTRLRHALAKKYAFVGGLDGWSAAVRQVAAKQPPVPGPAKTSPQADEASGGQGSGGKPRWDISWSCPDKPRCRTVPAVARALGLEAPNPAMHVSPTPSMAHMATPPLDAPSKTALPRQTAGGGSSVQSRQDLAASVEAGALAAKAAACSKPLKDRAASYAIMELPHDFWIPRFRPDGLASTSGHSSPSQLNTTATAQCAGANDHGRLAEADAAPVHAALLKLQQRGPVRERQHAASAALMADTVHSGALPCTARDRLAQLIQMASTAQSARQELQKARGTQVTQLQACVLGWHTDAQQEMLRQREQARMLRLAALASSDMQAYASLLRTTHSARLQEILDATNACLSTLADRLGLSQLLCQATAGCRPPSGSGSFHSTNSDAAAHSMADASGAWSRLAARLAADVPSQPGMLQGGQLRDHQMQGLRWLVALHDAQLSGILADEMGLGKTVQVIALFCHLVESQRSCGPFLVAAPASVLPHWVSEFARWAPDLKVICYHGSARDALASQYFTSGASFHVLITSYELLMGKDDRPRLASLAWSHVVVDEGHRLKDAGCKLAREMAHYKSRCRLLLTGTPLQNRLGELWALLHFLMPGSFGPAEDFERWFSVPLEALRGKGASSDAVDDAAAGERLSEEEFMLATNRLHQVLRPFMLRRLVRGVATELPGRVERVVKCALTPYQSALNNMVLQGLHHPRSTRQGATGAPLLAAKHVSNTLMELRKIANHPLLCTLHPPGGELDFTSQNDGRDRSAQNPALMRPPPLISLCGKMEVLDRLLLRLHATGHKVLLFSTMTRVLDLVEELVEWRGLSCGANSPLYLRLDGNTDAQARGDLVTAFNSPGPTSPWLFLLSMRAGGLGLNLQAADTVIMFDSDFNPQVDAQAQARAYRIGQTNKVLVLRLVTIGSVDEHVQAVAAEKQRFADCAITGGFYDHDTTEHDRRTFLLGLLQQVGSEHAASDQAHAQDQVLPLADVGPSDDELEALLSRDGPPIAAAQPCLARVQVHAMNVPGAPSDGLCPTRQPPAPCRLLSATDVEPLIELMHEHNTRKDSDVGKEWGRGMRTINALRDDDGNTGSIPDSEALTMDPSRLRTRKRVAGGAPGQGQAMSEPQLTLLAGSPSQLKRSDLCRVKRAKTNGLTSATTDA